MERTNVAGASSDATANGEPSVTVVFMGDSITEGQYVHHSRRWTTLVSTALRQRFRSFNDDLHFFFNRGGSGETTRQGLERFPRDVQNVRPDVMTLQFGLNDCNCWDTDLGLPRVSMPAYRANLAEMIERARRFGCKHIVMSTNHPTLRHKTLASGRSLEAQRKDYNAVVREVAAHSGVTLCDIESAFSDLSEAALRDLLLPEPDVLHLSEKGHEKYARAILPFLESAIDIFKSEKK